MTSEEIERAISDLETSLERLHALYNQYFQGIEKIEPMVARKKVDRMIHALRREQIRNTALRFRFQTQVQKYNTQSTYWRRICRQIEEGTYQRHVQLAKRRQEARVQQEEARDEAARDTISELIDTAKASPPAYELDMTATEGLSLDDPFAQDSNLPPSPTDPISMLDDPFAEAELTSKPAQPASPAMPSKSPAAATPGNKPPRAEGRPDPATPKGPIEGDTLKSFFSRPSTAPPPPPAAQPPKKQPPPAPKPKAAPKTRPANQASGFDANRAKAIYRTYLAARKRCNEPTENLTLEKVTRSLKKQLAAKDGQVDFKVVIRGGKAAIKAVKKDS